MFTCPENIVTDLRHPPERVVTFPTRPASDSARGQRHEQSGQWQHLCHRRHDCVYTATMRGNHDTCIFTVHVKGGGEQINISSRWCKASACIRGRRTA